MIIPGLTILVVRIFIETIIEISTRLILMEVSIKMAKSNVDLLVLSRVCPNPAHPGIINKKRKAIIQKTR